MSRVFLAYGHYGHAIGTALWRQVKIDNFRELFLQYGNEHFIERRAQYGGLVRRTACVSAVVNRRFPVCNGFDSEYREALYFIVIAGVITKRTLVCQFTGLQIPFQNIFSGGRHLQSMLLAQGSEAFCQLGFTAA